jgi:hypothetical protein
MTVTCALAMAAPDESVTVPVIEAVSCANSAAGRQIEDTRRQNHRIRDFIINSLIANLRQNPTRVSLLKLGTPTKVLRDTEIYLLHRFRAGRS